MKIQVLSKKEKKDFEDTIQKNFGISLPRGSLIKAGKEKIRLFTGDFSEHELNILSGLTKIETIGIYFARREDDGIRINFDACNILKSSKNIIDIDEQETKEWLAGKDISNKTDKKGYVLLKFDGLIVGCGKACEVKILNFVPRERRVNMM